MDGASGMGGIKIDKLNESNFHEWRQRIQMVLALRDMDDMLNKENTPREEDTQAMALWERRDVKARAIIGLTLGSEQLEHVAGCDTAADMWTTLQDVFQRKSLMNKMKARREFYSVMMDPSEKMLTYINRVRNLGENLKAMGGEASQMDVAMSVLNGLPSDYESLIVALDAKGEEELNLDFVKSRLLQEERRQAEKKPKKSYGGEMALMGRSRAPSDRRTFWATVECYNCHKKGHLARQCTEKVEQRQVANVVHNDNDDSEGDAVCLLGRASESKMAADTWVVDSGASAHMCWDRVVFKDYKQIQGHHVIMGDKDRVPVSGTGHVIIHQYIGGKPQTCKLLKVLHVPSMAFNLMSVSCMDKRGATTRFSEGKTIIKLDGKTVATGTLCEGLYYLDIGSNRVDFAGVASIQRWHERLGHVNYGGLKKMVKDQVNVGMKCKGMTTPDVCRACVYGKATHKPFPTIGGARASRLLGLVHTDVCGPMPVPSRGGALYFVTFTDDKSRWTHVCFLKAKSETFSRYKEWMLKAEVHVGSKLGVLRSDGGGEYISNQGKDFHAERGITHQTTVADTPQQNGVAERLNRVLMEMARTMMKHKAVDDDLWADAVKTAVYIKNRLTSSALPAGKTPFELWMGKKPNVEHMRVFGSTCYVVQHKKHIDGKLGDKAVKGVFVGYCDNTKGYKVILSDSQMPTSARSVVFQESNSADTAEVPDEDGEDQKPVGVDDVLDEHQEDEEAAEQPQDILEAEAGSGETLDVAPRRSGRVRQAPVEFWRGVGLIAQEDVPLSFNQAIAGKDAPNWEEAMKLEMESILKNKTWELVKRPAGKRILRGKWVYRVKNEVNKNGEGFLRHKARWCFMGNRQVEGVDYTETFAPVAKFTTIRVILAMAVAQDWELHQMDVKTAFLYGDLKEEVYMEQPDGFKDKDKPDHVCHLLQALYGLKQAPKMWYAKLDEFLVAELSFEHIDGDSCLYILRDREEVVVLTVYVDDLLIAASTMTAMEKTKALLSKRFEMKDLGDAKLILGMEITRNRVVGTLKLAQTKYAEKVLEKFKMAGCKTVATPMEVGLELVKNKDPVVNEPYREAVGSLMYLMVGTRPDLAFAVGKLSRYVDAYGPEHWTAIKRALRYVNGTKDKGLLYTKHAGMDLLGYSDADWAGDHESRRSTSGHLFILGGAAVSWASTMQKSVALSTMEAEYMALSDACKEGVWLSKLIQDVEAKSTGKEVQMAPVKVMVDNAGCINFAKNPVEHKRTKHIDIRYHFVREVIGQGNIVLAYCPTQDMTADPLTKEVAKVKHALHVGSMGLR